MYRSRDGRWTVEHVSREATDGRPGDLLRVCHHGRQVALCRTVDEVAQLLPLSELELVDDRAPASAR